MKILALIGMLDKVEASVDSPPFHCREQNFPPFFTYSAKSRKNYDREIKYPCLNNTTLGRRPLVIKVLKLADGWIRGFSME